MSVICLLSPVSFILSPLSRTCWLGMRKAFLRKTPLRGQNMVLFCNPLDKYEKKKIFWGVRSLLQIDQKKDILEFFVLSAIAK